MSRRSIAMMAALALAAPLAFASDAVDRMCVRVDASLRFVLAALFEPIPAEPVDTGTAVFTTGPMELLIVRLGEDGKPVAVCVDNEEAAQKFLDAPVERLQTKQAREQ